MINSVNLQVHQKNTHTIAAPVNFTNSLNKAIEISKKLDSWNYYERLPELSAEINYTDCFFIMQKALEPALERDCKLHIIDTLGLFCDLGWIQKEKIPVIGRLYYETISHLPERYVVETLSRAVKTWDHGQYAKVPTPAFLTSCIPEEYHDLNHRCKRMSLASNVFKRSPRANSEQVSIGKVQVQYKKIDTDQGDLV